MFMGACAGSTAGGLKVSRVILFFKSCHAEFRHMLHPRSVNILRMEGKKVEKETQKGVVIYFTLYMLCFFGIYLFLSLDGKDFETTFTAVAATINNIGPGFGQVGPASSFNIFSPFAKIVLSFSMLLGRLELWPILLTFHPGVWKRAKKDREGNL
jgi:trk system potassium uptake protein TrkH